MVIPIDISPAETVDDFTGRLAAVKARIEAARERSPYGQSVRLLAVSKTVSIERLRAAIEAGIVDLGENKVQEIELKAPLLGAEGAKFTMIGNLQTNKARTVIKYVDELHSLDRIRLAEALHKRLMDAGKTLRVYVQVNTSGEASKYGLAPHEVAEFLKELPRFPTLKPVGFMTLAVFSSDTAAVRECFVRLREVRDEARESLAVAAEMSELSMGMSGDFEVAIEEGATVVRVGQAIFGSRETADSYYWPASNPDSKA